VARRRRRHRRRWWPGSTACRRRRRSRFRTGSRWLAPFRGGRHRPAAVRRESASARCSRRPRAHMRSRHGYSGSGDESPNLRR
jgi:hypothetical protein